MDFTAESTPPSTAFTSNASHEQKVLGQVFSVTVTFDEALAVIDELVLANRRKCLSEAEILVIKGAWHNEEYEEIAHSSDYTLNYLQRRVAPPLWDLFSKLLGNGEKIGKKLKVLLEQVTKSI